MPRTQVAEPAPARRARAHVPGPDQGRLKAPRQGYHTPFHLVAQAQPSTSPPAAKASRAEPWPVGARWPVPPLARRLGPVSPVEFHHHAKLPSIQNMTKICPGSPGAAHRTPAPVQWPGEARGAALKQSVGGSIRARPPIPAPGSSRMASGTRHRHREPASPNGGSSRTAHSPKAMNIFARACGLPHVLSLGPLQMCVLPRASRGLTLPDVIDLHAVPHELP